MSVPDRKLFVHMMCTIYFVALRILTEAQCCEDYMKEECERDISQ